MNRKPRDSKGAASTTGIPLENGASMGLDVLVVEDNRVNQLVVVALLTKWGHRVAVACDGARGLEALERQEFDLVLMDIQMPVMDGIDATRAIRERERKSGGHIPIIAITAHAAAQDRVRCFDAGMDSYLTKPIKSELLRAAIAELFPETAVQPTSSSGQASGGYVDFDQLKEFVGEDPALLAEVIQIFLDDAPVTLENAARGITDADSRVVEMSAHRLKGSLSTMGAAAAAETANLLESLAHGGVLVGAAELCEQLRYQVDATSISLRQWKSQSAA